MWIFFEEFYKQVLNIQLSHEEYVEGISQKGLDLFHKKINKYSCFPQGSDIA